MKNELQQERDAFEARINSRFQYIEDLLRMLIVSTVENQTDELLLGSECDQAVEVVINQNGFSIVQIQTYGECLLLFLRGTKKTGIREMRRLIKVLSEENAAFVPVFLLEKATRVQKEKFIDERISFVIANQEIHIVTRGT